MADCLQYLHIGVMIVFLSPLFGISSSSNIEGGHMRLAAWTQEETGQLGLSRSPEEEDQRKLMEICGCFLTSNLSTFCFMELFKYGPSVRQGNCPGDHGTRKKRTFARSDTNFSSPPTFIEDKKCQGTKTIVLSSSGQVRQLTLTTEEAVFICPGSIDASLQQLTVDSAAKVVIASLALKPRDSDLHIRFSNLRQKTIIPKSAFTVETTLLKPGQEKDHIEIDETPSPPPKIKLEIDVAEEVEFKGLSVAFPTVQLKLHQIKNVIFDSKSIIPYVHPEASYLEISHCQSVTMDTETIITGKFEVKHVKQLLIKEKAVEVVADDGAGARIEYVSNVTIMDEGLTIGSGADILLNNLTFGFAGVRSIQSINQGNLRRATFTYVTGKNLSPVALCIKAETAVLYYVEIKGDDTNQTGACIEGQTTHQSDNSGVAVVCQKVEGMVNLCGDLRCSPCNLEAEDITPILITTTTVDTSQSPSTTSKNATTAITSIFSTEGSVNLPSLFIPQSTVKESTSLSVTHIPIISFSLFTNETVNEDHGNFDEQKSTYLPLYIIIILLCTAIIFIAFITYMMYKCYRRKKRDKYYLPHENRLSTFHNPRTIMTPENLTSQNNMQNSNDINVPEIYMTYDSYQQPSAVYTPSSDTLDGESSCSSTENQFSYTANDSPSANDQLTYVEMEGQMPPLEYQLPDVTNQDYSPDGHLPLPDNYYLHPEDELAPQEQYPCESHLTLSGDQLPPPDGYILPSDNPGTDENFPPLDDEYYLSESGCPSSDRLSPHEDQMNPCENQVPDQDNQILRDNQPTTMEEGIPISDEKLTQSNQIPSTNLQSFDYETQLPTLNEEASSYDDGNEMTI